MVSDNSAQKDLDEFFGFILNPKRTPESLVQGYIGYHGGTNWGQQQVLVKLIKSLLGSSGEGLTRGDILGPNGDIKTAFLARFMPQFVGEYFDEANPVIESTVVLPPSENEWQDTTLPPPINARLRLPHRPALTIRKTSGHSLFLGPYGYQIFDPGARTYYPMASSRAFARSIDRYPQSNEASSLVLIQDSYDGGNFAHFLFDWVPRILYFIKAKPDEAHRSKFILGGKPGPFQREILRRIGERLNIQSEKFIFPTSRSILKIDGPIYYFSDQREAMAHPLNMCHKSTIRLVDDLFDDVQWNSESPPKIYVSRRDASLRKISNEDALSKTLQSLGFVDICLSDFGVLDQMAIFKGAKSVVAPHGMGLTHLFFSSPNTEVLELFHPEVGSDDYAFVARARGFQYDFLLGTETDSNTVSYNIDIDSVVSKLSKSN